MPVESEGSPEVQYETFLNDPKKNNLPMGAMRAHDWFEDSRRLAFTFSRYKFVAKMLTGKSRVLEIGAGDGFASKLVLDNVTKLHLTDFKDEFVQRMLKLYGSDERVEVSRFNPLKDIIQGEFDGIYLLDVMEHISSKHDHTLLRCLNSNLNEAGICIIGMPSLESQTYASQGSKEGHVNCKSGESLRDLLSFYFQNVFMFSMNDEVVHTGFQPMAHYILGMGVSPKR